MKRLFDVVTAGLALAVFSPILACVGLLIWLQDFHSPFYRGVRVGQHGRLFRMVKFRSMVVDAERSGVRSTAEDDPRVTALGRFVRRFKLDELPQLWNVLLGEMSFVGPRPGVPTEVGLYSSVERALLTVRPGITDFASIVFADEGEVLRGSRDPDRDYNLLIRPWKSRLGLHYVARQSFWLDLELILVTALALAWRRQALKAVQGLLRRTRAPWDLVRVTGRGVALVPTPPPGVAVGEWERHVTCTQAATE